MSTALEDVRAKIAAQRQAVTGSYENTGFPKISTAAKMFTLPNGTSHRGPLNCLILDYRNTRAYFPGVWNPQDPKPPVCSARAKKIEDLAPSDDVEDKQANTCASCPLDEWGSDPNGGKGKACKSGVRLALVPADFKAATPIMALDVSPTGLKSWSALLQELEVAEKAPLEIVTNVGFNQAKAYPTLTFEAGQLVEDIETAYQLYLKAQPLLDR
jgi:hypothetical protein